MDQNDATQGNGFRKFRVTVYAAMDEDTGDAEQFRFEQMWDQYQRLGLRGMLLEWRLNGLDKALYAAQRLLLRVHMRERPADDPDLADILAVWLVFALGRLYWRLSSLLGGPQAQDDEPDDEPIPAPGIFYE